MAKLFNRTGSLKPGRSMFNLSYEKKFTCDMGQLIPVMCEEMVPGDFFKIGNQSIIRFQPLVAPILHEINQYVHYFFVPYRLLWDDWEDFISGGVDGDFATPIPRWTTPTTTANTLWDYFGFPVGITPTDALPISFPRDAYNLVYNEYYRDETLQDEVALTQETILNRNWEKDYFTSSLVSQQRGIAPSLPITGTTHAIWADTHFINSASGNAAKFSTSAGLPNMYIDSVNAGANAKAFMDSNTVDLSTASTFDIADLRLAFQVQKWMERNNRAGVRYIEFLKVHFGVAPTDERLQRPEYVGGSKSPVIISEVLQTSSTDATTPQGNLAGHGISVSESYCGKYLAKEYGLIIGMLSVMPRTAYSQGINRQWLRRTKYDFYFPEFANLSEQAIENAEICATATGSHNTGIFGYQGRYDEMRIKDTIFCSGMRTTYDYWHMGREFNVASPPTLNSDFITCVPRKDIFAVPAEPGLIVNFGNLIKAYRPLPLSAEPGLIDHN
ncbi:MAG: major capsid protein [Arizlama microvirus]|nr:MAG: major capsid protein [Arizlama microvirus]